MSIRPAPASITIVLLVACSSLACENNGTDTVIGPGSVESSNATYISRADRVEPRVVAAVPVSGAACPITPPFLAPLNVVVPGDTAGVSALTAVQMRFTDVRGTVAGFTTFTHSDLTSRFGSTVVPMSGTRTFPFFFPFGCGGVAAGTLNVVVLIAGSDGHERRSSHTVLVTAPA